MWCKRLLYIGILLLFVGWTHGFSIPTPDTKCGITTGNCTGVGAGSALFTAASCNGSVDDVAAFNSFNSWAVSTWQAAHPGLLMELDAPNGAVCEFISGNVNSNLISQGLKRFQFVGYGATLADHGGTGGGFALGGGAGVHFDNTHSARLATVSAGASCVNLLTPAQVSLWSAGDYALITGVDTQGFGDPPNPAIFEWPQVASTDAVHQCDGTTSGASVHFTAALANTYESTWPVYNAGSGLNSDEGGPATLYALNQNWNTFQAYYGLTIDQEGAQTNAIGRDITLRDMTFVGGFGVIPSQNLFFRETNISATNVDSEFDKIVSNVIQTSVNFRQIKVQQASPLNSWVCANCTINNSLQGTPGPTTFVGGSIADLQLGALCCGVSGSFSATNTIISSLEYNSGASQANIDSIGVWSSAGLTVPQNMAVSAAAATCGAGCTEFTVTSTAGWTNGVKILFGAGNCSQYAGTWPVTVIDGTHFSIPTAFVSTCSGSVGNLPLSWAVPRANVYFNGGSHGYPVGPILQIADIAVGANNTTVVSFNQNGLPYAGGLPTMPGGPPFAITAHPAPSWSCTGCTGAINVTDVTGVPVGPLGSQATRVVTASNSGNATPMPAFGPLSELDMTVTAACGGASNIGFEQTMFIATLGSTSFGSWNPTANALTASVTPRVVTPTTSSGAQTGDSLVTPGANTLLLAGQAQPFYSAVGNCGSASTTVTLKTNQAVVYP